MAINSNFYPPQKKERQHISTMLCRHTFQIVPRKHLMMIEELFWFSTQFHLMIILQTTRRSTRCVFCSTSETCWVNKLAIMFCWPYVSPCDAPFSQNSCIMEIQLWGKCVRMKIEFYCGWADKENNCYNLNDKIKNAASWKCMRIDQKINRPVKLLREI